MSVIYIVLPLALVLAAAGLAAFLWAVRSGQLEDLETPAIRVALEDDDAPGVRGEGAAGTRGAEGGAETRQHPP